MTSTFLLAAVTLIGAYASDTEPAAEDVLADLEETVEVVPMCTLTAGNTKEPTYEDDDCVLADAEPVEDE